MTPRMILVYISLLIVLFNLLTLKYRERKAARLEDKLRSLAKRDGFEMSIHNISAELEIPLYDARILTRKFVTRGKMEMRRVGEMETYVFKS